MLLRWMRSYGILNIRTMMSTLSFLSLSQSLQPGLVKGRWTKVRIVFLYYYYLYRRQTCAIDIYSHYLFFGSSVSQEEDDRIVEHVTKANGGDVKWSSLRLPGRIGEQIKQRWENILDPKIKKVCSLLILISSSLALDRHVIYSHYLFLGCVDRGRDEGIT